MKRLSALCFAAALLAGCAYQPLVDTKGVDPNRYEADLRECQEYAQQVAGPGERAVVGAVAGAVVGALVMRLLCRDCERGANVRFGAAMGAAGGASQGAQAQRAVVQNCLAGRGYRVLL